MTAPDTDTTPGGRTVAEIEHDLAKARVVADDASLAYNAAQEAAEEAESDMWAADAKVSALEAELDRAQPDYEPPPFRCPRTLALPLTPPTDPRGAQP